MDIMIGVKRREFFWKELSPVTVGDYLTELKKVRKELDNDWYVRKLTRTDKFIDELKTAFDGEIKLCQFYFELHKKKKSKNFNKWRELSEQEKNDLTNLNLPDDCKVHAIDNAKVTCYVIVSKPSVMTLIELVVRNASKFLEFTEDKILERIYRSSEETIKEGILKLKAAGEDYIDSTAYPLSADEKIAFDNYNKLLGGDEK